MTPDPALMSVRTDVVLEVLVGSLAEAVQERLGTPLPAAAEAALARAGDEEAVRAARAGWHARMVELDRFERAREPVDEQLGGPDACLALAGREPLERPQPGDPDAVTWRVPGPGGHVRHYLAAHAVGDGSVELKRAWVFGFLLACAPLCDDEGHCITCADEAVPMKVLAVDEARGLGLCEDAAGERCTVELSLVDAAPGDEVLVHAGTAIA